MFTYCTFILLHTVTVYIHVSFMRGSGDKPISITFCTHCRIAERLIKIPEVARSTVRELGYPNLKPEQLKVVDIFVKGCDVFAVCNNIIKHYLILSNCRTKVCIGEGSDTDITAEIK